MSVRAGPPWHWHVKVDWATTGLKEQWGRRMLDSLREKCSHCTGEELEEGARAGMVRPGWWLWASGGALSLTLVEWGGTTEFLAGCKRTPQTHWMPSTAWHKVNWGAHDSTAASGGTLVGMKPPYHGGQGRSRHGGKHVRSSGEKFALGQTVTQSQ
jgi:hypothetical protein